MLLEGIFPAATTPFYGDGRLYLRKLEHNIDRYSRTPVSGIAVLGSTGEAVMLDESETREALRTAALAAAPEKVLLAGIGQGSAIATIRMCEFAAETGYDVALVRTPFYYAPQMSAAAMLTYYRTVADQSPLPVVLYSIPKFTHYDLPVELIAELAHHPNIIGLKDSSGSVERIAQVVAATAGAAKKTFTVTPTFTAVTARMHAAAAAASAEAAEPGRPAQGLVSIGNAASAVVAPAVAPPPALRTRTREAGFQVLCGAADKLLPSLEAGAVGGVLAFAACAPQATHEVYIAHRENDAPLAEEKQSRIVAASQLVAGTLGVPGVKYACDLNGYYGGFPRIPLLPLTAEQKREVETNMRLLRN